MAQKAANRLGIALRFASDEGANVDETAVPKAKRLLGKVPDTSQRIPHTPWEAVPALYERICSLTVAPAVLAVRLALLTAQRAGPVRHARVEQFDLDAGIWTIPAEALKGRVGEGEDFRCPLSLEAIRVVELAQPFAAGGKLFPAQRGGGVLSDVGMSKVLNRIKEQGRVHGLRSSFADWAEARGHSFEMTERCLQHVMGSKVARAYRRDDQLETRRKIMDAWAAYAVKERDATRRAALTVV